MNENKNHNKHYSAEEIQRYLKGQMSTQEMHAIETAALDDPFLADAIEGLQVALEGGNADSLKMGLGKLNKQFEERIKNPAVIVPITQSRWWQVAAAVLILVIMGVAFYNNWMKPGQDTNALAVNETKQNDSSVLPKPGEEKSTASALYDTVKERDKKSAARSTSSKDIVSAPLPAQIENEPLNKSAKQKNPSPAKEDAKSNDQAFQNDERSRKGKEEVNDKSLNAARDARERPAEVAAVSSSEPLIRRERQSYAQLNHFSGRVVDPDNKPLPNASVQILQNRTNLLTDQSGNFNFTAKDSIVDVQVGLIGFEQRNFRLQNNLASNNIVLEPGSQNLNEVVITGYGTQRKKDVTNTTVKVQDAVPQVGWIEYEKYLEKNKKPPVNNPLMKGDVVVSFQVKREGTLSDFKIEKGLSKDYDTEAIRLIREGPAWKLLNNQKTRITVIVKF